MLIFIGNQFIGDKLSTGGDIVATEVAKRYPQSKIVLSPQIIHSALKSSGLVGEYYSTDNSQKIYSASTISGAILTTFQYLTRAIKTTYWLIKFYKSKQIIYLSGDFFCNTVPAFICWVLKSNCVIYANFYHRNPLPKDRKGNRFFVSLGSWILQTFSLQLIKLMSKRVFVLSEIGKQELLKIGFRTSNIIISGAGIDVNVYKKYLSNAKQHNKVIFVGRINVTKGAFDLIEIMSIVADKYPNFQLDMIGMYTEPDYHKLSKLISKYNLSEKIFIRGFVSDEQKYQQISTSKCLLLPSKEEGFGIVVMEALSLNTQVVCYKLPALSNLFGDKKGIYFADMGDKLQFANFIIKILSTKLSPNLRTQIHTWDDVYKAQFS